MDDVRDVLILGHDTYIVGFNITPSTHLMNYEYLHEENLVIFA